jgi:hypothetical protein
MCLPLLFLLFDVFLFPLCLVAYFSYHVSNVASKELATVSDSNSEEEVASINDMFKREMAIFLKLYRKIKV